MLNTGKHYNDLNVWLEARKLSKDIILLRLNFQRKNSLV